MNPGDVNRNRQELVRVTEVRGRNLNARVWVMKCQKCGHLYGANSTDGCERKCPRCQGGQVGVQIPAEREGEKWNREEHIVAFNLYSQIPFGTIHMRNPKVRELAGILGRTVGAVSYKLANFARLDPSLQARGIRGMPRGAQGEQEVWEEFRNNSERLAYESARLLAARLGRSIEQVAEIESRDLPPPGVEREALVRLRVNQSFFRKRVLSAYQFRCCVTDLAIPQLLVASHVIPWAEDPMNRLNPRNGLCLNALHDRAFDRGLMWIEDGYVVRLVLPCTSSRMNHELCGKHAPGVVGGRRGPPAG
jgi:putative restriction endonuclease